VIRGTLTLKEAAGRAWDVVVVGSGPAGSLAGRELARCRLSVLLVDRAAFPRDKVCGCCLNGSALGSLRAAGLEWIPEQLGGVALCNLLLGAWRQRALLPLHEGVALSRRALDAALVAAAIRAGVSFLPETQAIRSLTANGSRRVLLRQNEQAGESTARLVLAADGLGGRFASTPHTDSAAIAAGSWIGAGVTADDAPAFYRRHTICMACGTGGYVGLVRLEDGRLDVAAALDPAVVRMSHHPGHAAAAILQEAGFPEVPRLKDVPWRGTLPLTRQVASVARERLFLLGDAAGYIEPFTGEGIAWALAAARAVIPFALRAVERWDRALAAEWTRRYQQTVGRHQRTCRWLVKVLRHPALTTAMVALLSRLPALANPVLRRLNQSSVQPRGALS